MCGRYITVTKIKEIEKRFNVKVPQPELFRENVNISHGERAPVITNEQPKEVQFFQFGFTPFWAKKQFYMVNARSEGDHNKENDPAYIGAKGIINKPMFRASIRSKRCLVIADAFIEGPKKERLSKPYVVYMKEGKRPFALAGIWDEWVNKDSGEIINSFAIITTVSNDLMQKIGHHRSPVILHQNQEKLWLDHEIPLNDVTALLEPYPAEELNAYPISADIKNPRANGLELLAPIGQRLYPEYDYEIYQEIKMFGMGETRAKERREKE